jgi:hypothetical protein
MAIKCPNCNANVECDFEWADDRDIQGKICLDCFCIFDLVDNADDAESGKGKKIGHKENKYDKVAKKLKTWHIREEDKKEPKKVKGGQL